MNNFLKATWKNGMYCLSALFLTTVLLSAKCASQEKQKTSFERDSILVAAREIIGSQKYCALVTTDSLGIPHIRTMNPFPPEEDMVVWMATNSRSDKAQQIRNNSKVCLYYADHSKASGYVTITGTAVLVDDMAEKLKRKRDYWDQAFPDWHYLLLIKVIPEKLEVINYRHGMMNGSVTWSVPSINFQKP